MRWKKVKGMSMSTPGSGQGLLVIGGRSKKKKQRVKKQKAFSIIGSAKPVGKVVKSTGKSLKKFRLKHLQRKIKTIYD